MQEERITSSKNPLIQHIRKLQTNHAYRVTSGEFVADGRKLLEEALGYYPNITAVILTDGVLCPSLPENTRIVRIPESLMQSLSTMRTPQGVIFTCKLPEPAPLNIHRKMLLLDRIQDPGNLGTILRTADAFDIPVILTNGCADPYGEKTVRASMGAVFRTIPQVVPLDVVLEYCQSNAIPIAATTLSDRPEDIRDIKLDDYLVAIGSEGQGICERILEAADRQVIIPMNAHCESLNAAIAASVIMWEMKTKYE